jgi:hypothetical protein
MRAARVSQIAITRSISVQRTGIHNKFRPSDAVIGTLFCAPKTKRGGPAGQRLLG